MQSLQMTTKFSPCNRRLPYASRTLVTAFALSSFMIDEETIIKVIAQTETRKINGPYLRIRMAAPIANSSEIN